MPETRVCQLPTSEVLVQFECLGFVETLLLYRTNTTKQGGQR